MKSKFLSINFIISICLIPILSLLSSKVKAENQKNYIIFSHEPGSFALSENNFIAPIAIDSNDYQGIDSIAHWFVNDLKMVTGKTTSVFQSELPKSKQLILAGTIGKNKWIDQLVTEGKLNISDIQGQSERSLVQVVEHPFPNVKKALILAGSDKRGTIYAMLNLSRQMGVSPWYWWADVPVDKHDDVYVKAGRYITNSPKVKYRGIFLNDEAPALSSWATEKFGGFNHKFYERVFELILRLRGNFMWPAMWGNAFYDDDPENGPLADKLGIVMGTSHHEPMGRAQAEWHRYGSGPWDYTKNEKVLSDFWTKGIDRNKNFETIVTVGMRGDGDKAMSEGMNISLLEKIVKDQRRIISKVTSRKAEETPQVWALYKEVQDYYDKGMRVPDDVTLLLCDDNWGNVRKLPDINAPARKGGYGMYYHVDYVGGPRSYKWINVSQIQRIWEQMNLSWCHHVERLWILNVGDLKPMEFPISFFLDMAWDPTSFNAQNLFQYTEDWCAQQFGKKYASEAARILNLYTKYNHRITPELLDANTYSLENYNEFERVRNDYSNLNLNTLRLYNLIPNAYKDAFDQLILFPVNATSNLYEMYYAVAKNHQLAAKNDSNANHWADVVKQCFNRDSALTVHYNQQIANGKWNHMMDQIHIGYRFWAEPLRRVMPKVIRVETPKIPNSKLAFNESNGYVSIEAENYQKAKGTRNIQWKVIPYLGKTVSAITIFPQNAYPQKGDSIYLEYAINFKTTGEFEINVLVSPTLNFNANKGLRYAISFDGNKEQLVNINHQYTPQKMEKWEANRINQTKTRHHIEKPGLHWLRIRVLEPGIVLQKILIDTGGLKPSYLGAPQSKQTEL